MDSSLESGIPGSIPAIATAKAIGFRPRGFRQLAHGDTFEWRCGKVTALVAEKCSTVEGEPVFTCTSTRARLTCTNRNGHGFWVSARSFYTF